jgi:hypothetical protein
MRTFDFETCKISGALKVKDAVIVVCINNRNNDLTANCQNRIHPARLSITHKWFAALICLNHL